MYLHCHQQGKAQLGLLGAVSPGTRSLTSGTLFALAPGQMPRALGGHYDFSTSRKVFPQLLGKTGWECSLQSRALISKGVIPASLFQSLSWTWRRIPTRKKVLIFHSLSFPASQPVLFPSLMAVSALAVANSRQRWHGCPGEPGWHPEATSALPPWRALAAVPVLPGERPPAPRAAGSTPLVTAGKGGCLLLLGLPCGPSAWH